jgi:putative redox protein
MVLGHCFTCTRHTRILSDLSQAMTGLGYLALRFDFSGNGQSAGDFVESTYSKQIRELKCAMEYIQAEGVSDIILAGHSMGCAAALLAAAQTIDIIGVIALSVDAMLLNPDRVLSEKEQFMLRKQGAVPFSSRGRNLMLAKDFFDDAGQYDLPGSISKIHCPVLLVYGGQDMMIDPDSGGKLKDARPAGTEVFTVKDADHMFGNDRDRRMAIDHVVAWVKAL